MAVIELTRDDHAEEELAIVFNRFDKDGDNELDQNDLVEMFRELEMETSVEECMDMLYCFDKNDDEKISFEEFVQIMLYRTDDRIVDELYASHNPSKK